MNNFHGYEVRKNWPVGQRVIFTPKGFIKGDKLTGIVVGHLYVNVLIIKCFYNEWAVSVFRCEKIN